VASLFGGSSARLIKEWHEGRVLLCTSATILREYESILKKFRFRGERVNKLIEELVSGNNCIVADKLPKGRWVEDDPEDDKFIAAALALGADYIISSDIHIKQAAPDAGVKVTGSGSVLKLLPDL
jgi:putative PIN family toxin of toxin-antitoxin system